jgi:hypothetical protein
MGKIERLVSELFALGMFDFASYESRTLQLSKGDILVVVGANYSCGAAIVFEQASEPLATYNGVAAWVGFIANFWEEQLVAFPLVVAFGVIMRAELGQRPRQRTFTEQNQPRQTLLFGGANPTFRKSVQIRASGWSGMVLTPPATSTDRNAAQNFVSRSCRT